MDVSKLCRSCMEEVAPWECENVDQKTMEMFSFCTNIEIPVDDNLPKHFCYKCTVLLESTYTYIKKARRVNGKLKRIIQKSTNNFVDKFLNKAASFEAEKADENVVLNNFIEPEKIDDETNDVKVNVNNVDHDIFDDDDDDEDDKCLSEFKSENVDIKLEPDEDSSAVVKKEETLLVSELDSNDKNNGHSSKMKFKSKKCQICKKNFASKGWYSRHMKSAHTADASEKELVKLKKKKSEKKKQRETKETGDEKGEIKCRVCDKVFSSKAWRTKHLNEQHSESVDGQKVFLCPYCPKTFSKYSHMYYHTTSHPDVAKHPCSTCGKAYRIRKELEQHMRTHLKDRPYACDRCDMRFKMKGILITHLKWHDGVRPFLCSICGRSFIQSGNLESHMRVHTGERPFACTECSFRSTSRVSLKRHELRHRGERPYPCTYCPKRFYESCSLTRHIRSHTRERPYRCPYCSRDFYDSGKRRRHFMMTHKMAADEIPPMDKDGTPVERTAQNSSRKRLEVQCQ